MGDDAGDGVGEGFGDVDGGFAVVENGFDEFVGEESVGAFVAGVVAEGRGEEIGGPPFGSFVFFEHGTLAGETGVVLFLESGPANRCGEEAVGVVVEEAHFVAEELSAFGAAVRAFPPDGDAEGGSFIGLEEGGFVPVGIAVRVVTEDGIVVAPSDGGDLREALAGNGKEMRGAVGGIVHGGEAVAPGAFAVFEEEGFQARMMVFAFRGEDAAESAFLEEIACGYGELLVVTGLGHHVSEAGAADFGEDGVGFVERHDGGDGAEDVLAGAQALENVFGVVRGGSEEADGFDLAVVEERVKGRVGLGAHVALGECGLAVRAKVGDGFDGAVGVFVKVEAGAESAADDAEAEFAGLGVDSCGESGEESAASERSSHRVSVSIFSMRTRAIYAAFDVFPRAKGASSHIASMVRALESQFGSVLLLCLGDGELPGYQREGGIEILRYVGGGRDLLGRATGFAQFVAGHAGRVREELEIAVFRDPWGGCAVLDAVEDCPCVFEVNALPGWELEYAWPGYLESHALRAKVGDMERKCLRGAAEILCVSGVTAGALRGMGVEAGKITVIPNAAEDTFFEVGEIYGVEIFVYFGGLQGWQGVETAVGAFGRVAGEFPGWRMVVVHSGTRETRGVERAIGRAGLGERVMMSGPLGLEELAEVVGLAQFTVAPLAETARNTVQGCCPVKIVESMAAGRAVVASDLAVCRELIRGGEDGVLVRAGDERAWAGALRKMMRDGDACARLGAAARDRARREFAMKGVHARLREVFARGVRA